MRIRISSETRSKIFCSKKVQTSIKENNLRRTERGDKTLSMKKNLLKWEGSKTIFLPKFSNETIVREQPVLLVDGS